MNNKLNNMIIMSAIIDIYVKPNYWLWLIRTPKQIEIEQMEALS